MTEYFLPRLLNVFAQQGQALDLSLPEAVVVDEQATPLAKTYDLLGLPMGTGLAFDAATRRLRGTPLVAALDGLDLSLTVRDSQTPANDYEDTASFRLFIDPAPPALNTPALSELSVANEEATVAWTWDQGDVDDNELFNLEWQLQYKHFKSTRWRDDTRVVLSDRQYKLSPLTEASLYDVRIRLIDYGQQRASAWSPILQITTTGTGPPATLPFDFGPCITRESATHINTPPLHIEDVDNCYPPLLIKYDQQGSTYIFFSFTGAGSWLIRQTWRTFSYAGILGMLPSGVSGRGYDFFSDFNTAAVGNDNKCYLSAVPFGPLGAGRAFPSGVSDARGLAIDRQNKSLYVVAKDSNNVFKGYEYRLVSGSYSWQSTTLALPSGATDPQDATFRSQTVAGTTTKYLGIVDKATLKFYERNMTTGAWSQGDALPTGCTNPTGVCWTQNGLLQVLNQAVLSGNNPSDSKVFTRTGMVWDAGQAPAGTGANKRNFRAMANAPLPFLSAEGDLSEVTIRLEGSSRGQGANNLSQSLTLWKIDPITGDLGSALFSISPTRTTSANASLPNKSYAAGTQFLIGSTWRSENVGQNHYHEIRFTGKYKPIYEFCLDETALTYEATEWKDVRGCQLDTTTESVLLAGYWAKRFTFNIDASFPTERKKVQIQAISDTDMVCYLYRGKGTTREATALYYNDDAHGETTDPAIITNELTPGDYTIEITTKEAAILGNFVVLINSAPSLTKPGVVQNVKIVPHGPENRGRLLTWDLPLTGLAPTAYTLEHRAVGQVAVTTIQITGTPPARQHYFAEAPATPKGARQVRIKATNASGGDLWTQWYRFGVEDYYVAPPVEDPDDEPLDPTPPPVVPDPKPPDDVDPLTTISAVGSLAISYGTITRTGPNGVVYSYRIPLTVSFTPATITTSRTPVPSLQYRIVIEDVGTYTRNGGPFSVNDSLLYDASNQTFERSRTYQVKVRAVTYLDGFLVGGPEASAQVTVALTDLPNHPPPNIVRPTVAWTGTVGLHYEFGVGYNDVLYDREYFRLFDLHQDYTLTGAQPVVSVSGYTVGWERRQQDDDGDTGWETVSAPTFGSSAGTLQLWAAADKTGAWRRIGTLGYWPLPRSATVSFRAFVTFQGERIYSPVKTLTWRMQGTETIEGYPPSDLPDDPDE